MAALRAWGHLSLGGRTTTFVDTTTVQVLGVVDGRDSAGVAAWLAARSGNWGEGVQVVAIDPA